MKLIIKLIVCSMWIDDSIIWKNFNKIKTTIIFFANRIVNANSSAKKKTFAENNVNNKIFADKNVISCNIVVKNAKKTSNFIKIFKFNNFKIIKMDLEVNKFYKNKINFNIIIIDNLINYK